MLHLAMPTLCSFQRKSTCWRTRCLNSRTASPSGKVCPRCYTSKSRHQQLVTTHGIPPSFVVADVVPDRRRNVRSSVADLRILYANQMQNLHSQIEGAAKYVPTMPGRHIITEMDGVLALNAATYKVDHAVKFVVLDDAVLVARRRRRRNNTESEKLVAERCWMLGEMLVLDSKDAASGCLSLTPFDTYAIPSDMTNVFKIRHGKETHVYRTEAAVDKKGLLATFRSVAEDLAAKRRKEREGEHERRKSLWVSGDVWLLASSSAICNANQIPDGFPLIREAAFHAGLDGRPSTKVWCGAKLAG